MKLNPYDLQRLLTASGYYNGGIDGDIGPLTLKAIDRLLSTNSDKVPSRMSDKRRKVAAAQLILDASGHEPGNIDGYFGHNTYEALNAWAYQQEHRKREDLSIMRLVRHKREEQSTKWPKQSKAHAYYGAVGTNQTRIKLPYAMPLAWDTRQRVTTMLCHEMVADSMVRIFERTLDHYGLSSVRRLRLDQFGGCLNVRKMRGGSSYSTHSWGIAIDIDPANNRLRWGSDRAKLARPIYKEFWRIVEDEGALSLGRTSNFDWMHFQFARL